MTDLLLPEPPSFAQEFEPYWAAISRGELAVPRCDDCGRWTWYPTERCRDCGRLGLTWTTVAPLGTLFSFTIAHRSFLPEGGRLSEPYAVGLVELDSAPGVRLVGLLGSPAAEVRIGMRLRATFDSAGGRRPPRWLPETPSSPV